jgi:hypothetical protein
VEARKTQPAQPIARQSATVVRLTLKVANPRDVRVELRDHAVKLGGFPVLVTDTRLVLRVPPAKLSQAMARIGKAGLVLEKTLSREDLSLQIARLEGQLESKRTILAELRGFFDTSDVAATLAIETNMNQLVTELEVVKGQLRVLHDRASLVRIEIDFQFKERDRVTEVVSPFEWLNTVDLQRFIEDFQ